MTKKRKINVNKRTPQVKKRISVSFKAIKHFLLGVFFVSFLLGVSAYGFYQFNYFINKPIENLVIEGDLHYLSHEKLVESLRDIASKSFVKEDLAMIQEKLLASAWVGEVVLTRHWPNTLVALVREQQPIARWADKGFVNFKGEIVKTKALEGVGHLPLLSGGEDEVISIMQQFKSLSPLLAANDLEIQSLEKNHLGVWRLELSNGWEVIIGRNDTMKKINNMLAVLEKNILLNTDVINTIDMRYERGFSVAWQAHKVSTLEAKN